MSVVRQRRGRWEWLFRCQEYLRMFVGDSEQFQGRLSRVSDTLFPAFYGIWTDIDDPREHHLTDIEGFADGPDLMRGQRLGWRRQFRHSQPRLVPLLETHGFLQRLSQFAENLYLLLVLGLFHNDALYLDALAWLTSARKALRSSFVKSSCSSLSSRYRRWM